MFKFPQICNLIYQKHGDRSEEGKSGRQKTGRLDAQTRSNRKQSNLQLTVKVNNEKSVQEWHGILESWARGTNNLAESMCKAGV